MGKESLMMWRYIIKKMQKRRRAWKKLRLSEASGVQIQV